MMIFTIIGFICLFVWIASAFSDPDTWGSKPTDELHPIMERIAEEIRLHHESVPLSSGMTPFQANMWDTRLRDLQDMYYEVHRTYPSQAMILEWNEAFRRDHHIGGL